jgi:excisionase family DNA binding protein
MDRMMTVRQVAELLGVHENWVYDQAASGELPSYKIGGTRRFDPDEVRGWIAEHREAERAQPKRRERKPKVKRTRPQATRRPDDWQPRLFE